LEVRKKKKKKNTKKEKRRLEACTIITASTSMVSALAPYKRSIRPIEAFATCDGLLKIIRAGRAFAMARAAAARTDERDNCWQKMFARGTQSRSAIIYLRPCAERIILPADRGLRHRFA